MEEPLTCKEAGRMLHVDDSRVRRLILDGKLPAKKHGRAWMIDKKDLLHVIDRRRGRPKKKGG